VHRDLKSLNLLLDNKWNVKVSDFGLTKFKEDISGKGGLGGGGKGNNNVAGSVHWTAPEVLNEAGDVDLILADVYSFGIILWELLTREQPYMGLSPAAVAVAVIRDNIRPRMPEAGGIALCPAEYEDLITSCWHHDPTIRPTFLEIMTRLSAMHGDSTSAGATSYSNSSSSASHNSGHPNRAAKTTNSFGSWTLPSTNSSSADGSGSSSSSGSSKSGPGLTGAAGGGVKPPEGEMAIVFTDITRAASLWEFNAAAMRDATLLHNETLRDALKRHRGYEVVFVRDRNSGEGSFCMAFQQPVDALAWCADVQRSLLGVAWPEALLEHPGAAEEWGDTDDRVLFKGLRVRMGVHVGVPRAVRDPMTRRVEYIGPVVNAAARITALTHGGQVVMSHAAFQKVKGSPELAAQLGGSDGQQEQQQELKKGSVVGLGKFEMPDAPNGTNHRTHRRTRNTNIGEGAGSKLFEIKTPGLEARFFGGVTLEAGDGTSTNNTTGTGSSHGGSSASGGSGRHPDSEPGSGKELQTVVGEGYFHPFVRAV
jgi:class 3 adenylate cyclase